MLNLMWWREHSHFRAPKERHAKDGNDRHMKGRDKLQTGSSLLEPVKEWWWEESDE